MTDEETRHLAISVPETERLRALLEEASLKDADLDALERRIEEEHGQDPGLLAAWALVLGRAGDVARAGTLGRLETRLEAQRLPEHAGAVRLALSMLRPRPERAGVERADSGYRFFDAPRGLCLYLEDPVAALWHAKGRWGPPIRPDRDRPPRLARATDAVDELAMIAEEGGVVVVCFDAPRFRAPEPPLRLTLAGFARDAELQSLIRWSTVRAIGEVMGPRRSRAAIETREAPLLVLPERSMLPEKSLVELLSRLLKSARS